MKLIFDGIVTKSSHLPFNRTTRTVKLKIFSFYVYSLYKNQSEKEIVSR